MKHEFAQFIEDPKELEEFPKWAFGVDYIYLTEALDFMHAWNALHGDVLMLRQDTVIQEDIPRMVALWNIYLAKIQKEHKDFVDESI